MTIAFFGTGLMGSGFVRRMRANGHQVNVWNRSPAKALALEADGAKAFADPAAALAGDSGLVKAHLAPQAGGPCPLCLSPRECGGARWGPRTLLERKVAEASPSQGMRKTQEPRGCHTPLFHRDAANPRTARGWFLGCGHGPTPSHVTLEVPIFGPFQDPAPLTQGFG